MKKIDWNPRNDANAEAVTPIPTKITTAFIRQTFDKCVMGKITYSKMVELINQEAERVYVQRVSATERERMIAIAFMKWTYKNHSESWAQFLIDTDNLKSIHPAMPTREEAEALADKIWCDDDTPIDYHAEPSKHFMDGFMSCFDWITKEKH